jgi:hypothetical protein
VAGMGFMSGGLILSHAIECDARGPWVENVSCEQKRTLCTKARCPFSAGLGKYLRLGNV